MCNGQRLSGIIVQILTTMMELDIDQKAKLEKTLKSNIGVYDPDVMSEDLYDINEMMIAGDVDGLLLRLKIYPNADTTDKIILYLSGSECGITTYLDADNIPGTRDIRFSNEAVQKQAYKHYLKMSVVEFSNTAYGDGMFTGSAGNGIFGGTSINATANRKLNQPNKTAFDIITIEVIERELLRNYSKGKYKTLKSVMKSDKIDELIGYLTEVMLPELVDTYLLIIWCKNGIRKAHKLTTPNAVKPTPKGKANNPTEVAITDEELDAKDNVMVGVNSGGRLLSLADKEKYSSAKYL